MSGFSTTTTFGDLIDEIILGLQGYTIHQDSITTLSGPISDTDTTIAVDDTSGFGRGVAEIGSELVYLKGVDASSSRLLTSPAWRGFRGTLAESHDGGTSVTFRPSFPRAQVAREVNNIVRGVYPYLYAVRTSELTANSVSPHYALPADCDGVLDVRFQRTGLEGWRSVDTWTVDFSAPASFSSRTVLNLYGLVEAGTKLQVVYATHPSAMTAEPDVFTTVTGLPESAKEVVVAGAQYRLTQHIDPGRLLGTSPQAEAMARPYQPGLAQQVASSFGKQYQEALAREREALNLKYPARVHRVR